MSRLERDLRAAVADALQSIGCFAVKDSCVEKVMLKVLPVFAKHSNPAVNQDERAKELEIFLKGVLSRRECLDDDGVTPKECLRDIIEEAELLK
jgi:hypothetical protein